MSLFPLNHIMICRKLNLELLCLLEHVEDNLYFILSSLGVVRGTSAFVSFTSSILNYLSIRSLFSLIALKAPRNKNNPCKLHK